MVRVELQGRRVAGWVVETGVEPPVGVVVKRVWPRVSSVGPTAEVVTVVPTCCRRVRGPMERSPQIGKS